LAGDKIVSGVGAAIIRFTDGTVVTLAPASQAKVERDKDSISVRLLSGFMSFVAAPDSLLHFYYGNTAIKAQAGVSTTAGSSGSSPVLNRSVDPPPPPPTLSGH
jgi:ferric-dicitrate binding protein FerR (iron transport regulator)